MAYVPDYSAGDLSLSIISTIVIVALVVGAFATVVALMLLWRFAFGKKRKKLVK